MFGAGATQNHMVNGCEVAHETPIFNGFKTSVFNVLAEDGFNVVQIYSPNEFISEEYLKSYIKLVGANNLKVELSAGHFYKPSVNPMNNYLGYGTNVYNNCGNGIDPCLTPQQQNYFRANINNFISNIYNVSPYKEIIWGYHICEEASYFHPFHFASNCQGNIWQNPSYFKMVEI